MSETSRHLRKAGAAEKVFDRLTLLLLNQELLLSGDLGPLTNGQKAVLYDMTCRSKEIATLLRDVLDP